MGSTYWKFIEQGKCGQCGKKNDRENLRLCSECGAKDVKTQIATKKFLLQMGICPVCKRERILGDEKSCPECRAKGAEYKAQIREENREEYNEYMKNYHKQMYEKRKQQGLCTRCGKPLNDKRYTTCGKCRQKNTKLRNVSYTDPRKKRVEQGLCYWCGKPQKQGYKVCEEHYQMNVEKARMKARNSDE